MNFSNKEFYIIYKEHNDKAGTFCQKILAWLKNYRATCHVFTLQNLVFPAIINHPLKIGQPVIHGFSSQSLTFPDFAIILGGDGTILEMSRFFAGTQTCIFGINFGKIGFLSATEPHDWETNFIQAIMHPEKVQKCAILKFNINSGTQKISGTAINDLVLGHGSIARLLNFDIKINGNKLGPIRSDGLIFYSPLGSTAYNSSAGGPIILPELDVMGMTPICPFMNPIKSLCFSCATVCQIKLPHAAPECFITVDGRINMPFCNENVLEITGWPRALNICLNEKKHFSQLASPY